MAARHFPPRIRKRLNKLLLMLGSDNDGERAAAAGMITKLLREHGLDWHDVVGAIGTPATAPHAPPRQSEAPMYKQRMTKEELQELVHMILRSPLNKRARDFLAGMTDRADIYGAVNFSDKQWEWLWDLARRAEQ